MRCKNCGHEKVFHKDIMKNTKDKYCVHCKLEEKRVICKQFTPSEKITTNYDKDNIKYLKDTGCGKMAIFDMKEYGICGDGETLCPSCSKLKPTNECQISSSNHSPQMSTANALSSNQKAEDRDEDKESDEKYTVFSNSNSDSGSDFNLSDKIQKVREIRELYGDLEIIFNKDVKESIKKLKEASNPDIWEMPKNNLEWERGFNRAMLLIEMEIDKIFGDKLI